MITKINISTIDNPCEGSGAFDEDIIVTEECSDCGGEAMLEVKYRRTYIETVMTFDDYMCMACYSKPDFQKMLFEDKTEIISVINKT